MHIADWKWTLILAVFYAAKYWWAWVIPLAAFIAWRWRKNRLSKEDGNARN